MDPKILRKHDKAKYIAEEERHEKAYRQENERHEKAHLKEDEESERRGMEIAEHRRMERHGHHIDGAHPRRRHELDNK